LFIIPNRIDASKMLIWHVNPYGGNDPQKDLSANNDPYAVLRKSSPWPARNAKCFQSLNAIIERFRFSLFFKDNRRLIHLIFLRKAIGVPLVKEKKQVLAVLVVQE